MVAPPTIIFIEFLQKVKIANYINTAEIIDLILGGYFRHIPNCYDVKFKRATQNWFP